MVFYLYQRWTQIPFKCHNAIHTISKQLSRVKSFYCNNLSDTDKSIYNTLI